MAFRQSSPAQPVPQPSPSTIRLDMKLLVETAPELRAALQKFLINNDCVDLAGLQTELSKDHQTALLNWVNAHPGAAQRTMQHEPEPQISMEQVERENREDIANNNHELWAKAEADQRAAEAAAAKAKADAEAKAAADADKARLAAIPRLPNGEEQLPLDAVPSHKHSVTQLRDLAQRQREAARSGPRAHGWRGSKF